MKSAFTPETIHQNLGAAFYDIVEPAHFCEHILRYRNQKALYRIGLEQLDEQAFIDHFGRFQPLQGSFKQPLALRYHGHQFGVYNPDIGDGRGFLFAQARDRDTHRLFDLGTKGSGRTPYARGADGRLTLKGAVREVLATEMLTALNVTTSKTVSVIETGEALDRHDEPSPTRSAVLVRLLHSHIRIGSFQRLAYEQEHDNIETLLRHVIRYYYPEIAYDGDLKTALPEFLRAISDNIALMVSGWITAGFVHGVLNTDNFNITGESFDYGPWRFLPYMDIDFTAAYFDHQQRYAYGRQPEAALWALCRLADCFLPFLPAEELGACFDDFYPQLELYIANHICWRLGVEATSDEQAKALTKQLFQSATSSKIGWDQLFKDGYAGEVSPQNLPFGWAEDSGLKQLASMIAEMPARQTDAAAIAHIKTTQLVSLELSLMESLWTPIAESDDWSLFYDYLAIIGAHGDALRAG